VSRMYWLFPKLRDALVQLSYLPRAFAFAVPLHSLVSPCRVLRNRKSMVYEIQSCFEGRRVMEQETYGHDTFLSPFTWRYGSQEMRRLWSEEHKRRLWWGAHPHRVVDLTIALATCYTIPVGRPLFHPVGRCDYERVSCARRKGKEAPRCSQLCGRCPCQVRGVPASPSNAPG